MNEEEFTRLILEIDSIESKLYKDVETAINYPGLLQLVSDNCIRLSEVIKIYEITPNQDNYKSIFNGCIANMITLKMLLDSMANQQDILIQTLNELRAFELMFREIAEDMLKTRNNENENFNDGIDDSAGTNNVVKFGTKFPGEKLH